MFRKICCGIMPSCCEGQKNSYEDDTITPYFTKNNEDQAQKAGQKDIKIQDAHLFHSYDAHFHSLQRMKISGGTNSTATCSAIDTIPHKYSFQRLPANQLFLLEKSPFRIVCLIRHHFKEGEDASLRLNAAKASVLKKDQKPGYQSCLGHNDFSRVSKAERLTSLRSEKVRKHVAKKFRDKTVLLINLFCTATEFIYEIVSETCFTVCLLDLFSSPFCDIPKSQCPPNIEFIYHRGLNFLFDSQLIRKGFYDVAIIDLMFRLQKEIYEKVDDELQIKEEAKIKLSKQLQYLVKRECLGIMLLLPPNLKLQDFAEIFYNIWFDADWEEEPQHYCLEFEVYYSKGEPECILGYYGKLSKVKKPDQRNFIAMKMYKDFFKHFDFKVPPERALSCLERIVSKVGLRKTLNIISCSHIRDSADSSLNDSQKKVPQAMQTSESKNKQKFVTFIRELAQEGYLSEGLLKEAIEAFPMYQNELSLITPANSDRHEKQSLVSRAKQSHTSHESPDTLTFNDLEVWRSSPKDSAGRAENSDLKLISKSEINHGDKASKSELSLLLRKSKTENDQDAKAEISRDALQDEKLGSIENSSSPKGESSKAYAPESQMEELIYSQYSSNGRIKLSLEESGLVDLDSSPRALENCREDFGNRRSVNNSRKKSETAPIVMKVVETPTE